jgi:hypothetical protein
MSLLRKVIQYLNKPIDITDNTINSIKTIVNGSGMVVTGNLYAFNYAIHNLPSDKPILEIGTFCGLSTRILAYYLIKNKKDNTIISCDPWDFEYGTDVPYIDEIKVSYSDYSKFVKDSFIRNTKFIFPEKPSIHFEMLSNDFFQLWGKSEAYVDIIGQKITAGSQFSFCYIDGNHQYEYAKQDFENCDRFLEIGGFVLFDDSSDGCGMGSSDFMKEMKSNNCYELVLKNPNYLFKKIK